MAKVKDYFLLFLAFLFGFGGVLGYQSFRSQSGEKTLPVVQSEISPPTPEPTLALVPPSGAVSGILTVVSGHAEKFSRNDTEYKEASTGAQILLGESIATKANSTATTSASGIVNISLGPSAELVFANLFPANFVLQQKTGKVDYLISSPISVRALHTLISMEPGEVIVNIIDTDLSITVKSSQIKFAIVDNDNNTNVYNLKAGQRANIADETRQVFIR